MKFPDFLIIGAMKSGTTTLYRDLLTHPRVFMSTPKEPHNLLDDAVLTPAGREAYSGLFRSAKTDQIAGEASTGYSKLPDHPGVPQRAKAVLGGEFKVIYIVREPVSRAISHHTHARASGVVSGSVDDDVRRHGMFVNWGLYAMQVTPWLEALGTERVKILRFESYVKDRPAGVAEVSRFLGIEPRPELVQVEKVFNKSEGKPVDGGTFGRLRKTRLYRDVIRPLLPMSARETLRNAILPKAPPPPPPPSADTVEWLIERLAPDAALLAKITGSGDTWWDFDDVRRSYAQGADRVETLSAAG